MSTRHPWAHARSLAAAGAASALLVGATGPAWGAGTGSIDHVEPEGQKIGVLYSIPELPEGVTPDLDSVAVTIDGEPVEASAELAADADAEQTVKRTAILAIDTSRSMSGDRFTQAKLAAEAFLAGVSPDVFVGIVAFAGDVNTVQEPSLDRAQSVELLDALTLTLQTRLYDGVIEAVSATGNEGQRSVLVLSDGSDTSETLLEDVTAAVADSGVDLDVVALAQGPKAMRTLDAIAASSEGSVLAADDPVALTEVFSSQAEALAQQVLVTVKLPPGAADEGTVGVSIVAGGETYTDSAFVPLVSAGSGTQGTQAKKPKAAPAPELGVSKEMMLAGLVAAGAAVLLLLLNAFGVLGGGQKQTVEERIAAYSRNGGGWNGKAHGSAPPPQGLTGSAVSMAEKALTANQGAAASIGARLEAAGMSLKPAEWLLMHVGISFGAGLVGFLMTAGSPAAMVLFLVCGAVLPWTYLGFKRGRRVKAFNSQLADTLQLISGGLSAGLSLAQSLDTVVKQGSEPMTTEFKRALVEARLGVGVEDALDSIAQRMQSKDFAWVVIAVRIQREVGGNLAEVLSQVAATIREREYLRRQVKSLSAEGVLSAWILGAMPPVMFVYFLMVRPEYMAPMFEEALGWMLLGVGAVLMAIGAFWMSRLVKLEV